MCLLVFGEVLEETIHQNSCLNSPLASGVQTPIQAWREQQMELKTALVESGRQEHHLPLPGEFSWVYYN